jgi:transposase InsO family protein
VEPPAVATIHRALHRNELVAARTVRPPRARKRFEREQANDLWQIDATRVCLADGSPVWVIDCLDDHARFLVSAHACSSPTGEAAWACFTTAAAAYGLPRQVLSDNGTIFTGRLNGVEVAFERRLAAVGVDLLTSAPYHPQTLGKLERLHRTLKEWLTDQPPAIDLHQLQALLDRFRAHYNEQRPHQGIADHTPLERYATGRRPAAAALPDVERAVASNGVLAYHGHSINIGIRYARTRVRIVDTGELVHIYHADQLVRTIAPDHTHRHQRLGKRRPREVNIKP